MLPRSSPHLTRQQSREKTRSRLLVSAEKLFGRDGYAATTVDRIAENAGFSKGAFYSNFDTKEHIFLEVFERYGRISLVALFAALDGLTRIDLIIDALADWANGQARAGSWSMAVLEFGRQSSGRSVAADRLAYILRAHWEALGERLLPLCGPQAPSAAEMGALLFELAHAPAMSFMSHPSSGDLVRVTLKALLQGYEGRRERPTVDP